MEKKTTLNRIAKVEKLAEIARESKTSDKCYQAYWILERLYKRLHELSAIQYV